jgi:hypothetical protein
VCEGVNWIQLAYNPFRGSVNMEMNKLTSLFQSHVVNCQRKFYCVAELSMSMKGIEFYTLSDYEIIRKAEGLYFGVSFLHMARYSCPLLS